VPEGAINVFPRRFAVTLLFPFIVTETVPLVPLASPLQPVNTYPADGVTLTCTTLPAVYPPGQFCALAVTTPPMLGFAFVVRL
jgi:hypothetical protein